jgi:hypothetical protein
VTGSPNDNRGDGELQPWEVPTVHPDALGEELPAEVAAAARRAFNARRPGVSVAALRERSVEADGTAVYRFDDAGIAIELRVSQGADRCTLHVSSVTGCTGEIEVLNGQKPTQLALDRSGSASLEVDDGLVSVVLSPARGNRAPVQTSWIRIP